MIIFIRAVAAITLAWSCVFIGYAIAKHHEDQKLHKLDALKQQCNYDPHPISDVAWELYSRGMIPIGTAWYYTGMVRSKNLKPADCMRHALDPFWEG